jgi:hypothetical protein
MKRVAVAVAVLMAGTSVASAGSADDLMAVAETAPAPTPSLRLQPPSSNESSLDGLMAPHTDHDIDMLAHAPSRRADRLWRAIDTGMLIVSTGMLACDWNKTRRAAARGWSGEWEGNPVLGKHPGATTVDVYFAATAVVNAAIWYALPRKWRSAIPALLTASQIANEISDQRKLASDQRKLAMHPGPDIAVCGVW